jgi:hypothetical protein
VTEALKANGWKKTSATRRTYETGFEQETWKRLAPDGETDEAYPAYDDEGRLAELGFWDSFSGETFWLEDDELRGYNHASYVSETLDERERAGVYDESF